MWFFLVIGSVPVTAITARWVLAPTLRSVERQQVDRQYSVLDLAYFFLMFSAASMLLRGFYLHSDGWEAIVAMMLVLPFVGAVWWLSLSCLNGRGIRGALRRAVFTVVAAPVAFVGPISAYGAAVAIILRPFVQSRRAFSNRLLGDETGLLLSLAVLFGALTALAVARLASSWVARAAVDGPALMNDPVAAALVDNRVSS